MSNAVINSTGSSRLGSGADTGLTSSGRLPLVLLLSLVLLILVPIEFSLRLGTLFLPWYRTFFTLMTILVILHIASGKIKLRAFDFAIIFHSVWVCICEFIKFGLNGIEPGFSYIAETLTAYLIVRIYMRDPAHFFQFCGVLFLLLIPTILLAAPEAFVKQRFIHDIASSLTGYVYRIQEDFRLGILRAASLFEHPILFGLFCSTGITIVWVTARSILSGCVRVAILMVGAALSASSAPLLLVIIQSGLLIGERLTRTINGRGKMFFWGFLAIYVFLSLFSNRGPAGIIATSLTLNAQSGYTRLVMWESSIDDIMRSPIIGIDPLQWTRPAWLPQSLDNHFLILAFKGGLPAVIALCLAIYMIVRTLYRIDAVSEDFKRLRMAISFTFLALLLAAATVTFFGKMQPFLFMIIGFGAALTQCDFSGGKSPDSPQQNKAADRPVPVIGACRPGEREHL